MNRAETQGAKLLLSTQVFSACLQPGKDPAIVIGEIMELLAALDEAEIPVHKAFIWLHFVDSLPPGYKFIKNNLQGSKARVVLEDALRTRCNVQFGVKKGRTISDTASFVSGSKAGWRVSGGGGHGGTNKGKMGSRGGSEELSSQAKITCNHCQRPGTFDVTVSSVNVLTRGCFLSIQGSDSEGE